MAERICGDMKTTFEFMDKGVKGLLTGDMSIFSIRKVQSIMDS